MALDIIVSVEAEGWAAESELLYLARRVAETVMREIDIAAKGPSELGIVFADDAAVQALNGRWRSKDSPTNVLSFPAYSGKPGKNLPPMLGDIVLARQTIEAEAALDDKPFEHHLAHLIAHGLLHLLGYDHETDAEADVMEEIERRVLRHLAIADPYR